MILCQNCLNEVPDGSAHCPDCGDPLTAPVGSPRPVRHTVRPAAMPPEMEQLVAELAHASPALPRPSWQPATAPVTAQSNGGSAAASVATLGFQFPSGQIYMLSGKRIVIGRQDPASRTYPDLDLTAEGASDAGVSRVHAAVHLRPDGYFIEDLESANDTLLNGQRLAPGQTYPLHSGDQVRFGLLNALVVSGGSGG